MGILAMLLAAIIGGSSFTTALASISTVEWVSLGMSMITASPAEKAVVSKLHPALAKFIAALEQGFHPHRAAELARLELYQKHVKALQVQLNSTMVGKPGFPIKEDGLDGHATRRAVQAFQYLNPPLEIDGVAGEATLSALKLKFKEDKK
jgi:hypothetical protein